VGVLGGLRGCNTSLSDKGIIVGSRGMHVMRADGAVATGGDGEIRRHRRTEEGWALGNGEGWAVGVGEVCGEGVVRGSLCAFGVREVGGRGFFLGAVHSQVAVDGALDEGDFVVGLAGLVGKEGLD
jgi:hypothetical protein